MCKDPKSLFLTHELGLSNFLALHAAIWLCDGDEEDVALHILLAYGCHHPHHWPYWLEQMEVVFQQYLDGHRFSISAPGWGKEKEWVLWDFKVCQWGLHFLLLGPDPKGYPEFSSTCGIVLNETLITSKMHVENCMTEWLPFLNFPTCAKHEHIRGKVSSPTTAASSLVPGDSSIYKTVGR